jgi:hypothetical protein
MGGRCCSSSGSLGKSSSLAYACGPSLRAYASDVEADGSHAFASCTAVSSPQALITSTCSVADGSGLGPTAVPWLLGSWDGDVSRAGKLSALCATAVPCGTCSRQTATS